MTSTPEGPAAKRAAPSPRPINVGLFVAVAALIAVLVLPPAQGLPVAGQRMLAVFCFAVVIWITEALDYAVSAIVIAALIAVLLGFSPDVAKPDTLMGTARGLGTAASGFANSALILVAAALFLAAAMTISPEIIWGRLARLPAAATRSVARDRRGAAKLWPSAISFCT